MVRKTSNHIDLYSNYLTENPVNKTKFKPEPPFEKYTRGFVYIDSRDGRKAVTLYTPSVENNNKGSMKFNMLASRYLYAVKLFKETGQLIPKDKEVDHIDNDCTNDVYSNFQLLSLEENARKEGLRVGSLWVKLICPVCLKQWNQTFNHSPLYKNNKNLILCCSQDCTLIFRSTLFPYSHFKELRSWISKNQNYQLVRKWKHSNAEKIESIVSDKMLNFDLAKASGREVRYDTLRLRDESLKQQLVLEKRKEGFSWDAIGKLFGLSGGQTRERYGNEETGSGVGGRKKYIHEEMIRLATHEGKTSKELAKMFNMAQESARRILRKKGGL